MINKNFFNNKIILTILFFIVSLMLGLLLFLPNYQEFKISQTQIKSTKEEIKQFQDYYSKIEKISEELQKYSEGLAKIDSALPSEPGLTNLYYFLQKNSYQTGLFLKEVGITKVSSLSDMPAIKTYIFPISLMGSYYSFKNFLSSLEKSARLIEVDSISFSYSKEDNFTFNLLIRVHSY